MKRTPFLTVLAGFVLLLASCKSGNKSGLFIPKDAAVVFHINSPSLSSKLTWEEIKQTTWFKDAYEKASTDSFAKKLMDDPKASGIDPNADFVFFLKKRGRGGFSVFEGSVKDAANFAALVKKMSHQEKAEKEGDWNVVTADRSTVVTWNDSKFAVINDVPMGSMNPMMAGSGANTRFGADSLKVFVKQVMTLSNDESLFDDDRFASVMKESGDMHLWMNSGILYSDMAGMLSMMKIGNLLQDNVTAASVNFEEGKIAARMKQYYGKDMQKAMEKWKFKNIDAAVIDRIPSQNVIGVMAMNIDPAGLKDFLKTIGVDGFINMFLGRQDLTLDELINATKGEFVMALSDLQMKDTTITMPTSAGEQPYTFTSSRPDMSFLFATAVNQKASFEKLLNTVKKETPEVPFAYQLNNDWFVAGNKVEAVNAFAAGGNVKHAFTDKITGHAFGFYLDVQRLLKTNFSNDATAKSLLAESAATWKDVVMVSNEFKDGVATSEMTINMVDGKTNSLKQLNQYIERMNAAAKANKVAFDGPSNDVQIDTAVSVPPPPPAVDEAGKH